MSEDVHKIVDVVVVAITILTLSWITGGEVLLILRKQAVSEDWGDIVHKKVDSSIRVRVVTLGTIYQNVNLAGMDSKGILNRDRNVSWISEGVSHKTVSIAVVSLHKIEEVLASSIRFW